MRKLLFVGFVLACAVSASAQKPFLYDVSKVVVGAQRIPTLQLLAAGKWSDASDSAGTLSTEIHCYKSLGFCEVAHVFSIGTSDGNANVALDSFNILRWDSHELIAVDEPDICGVVSTIRVDLATKRVTRSFSGTGKGVTKGPLCKGSEKLSTAVLWGSKDSADDAINRAKSKK